MADAEVSVTVRPRGFDELAVDAERAAAMLKELGNAARGVGEAPNFARSFEGLSAEIARAERQMSAFSRSFSGIGSRLTELRRDFRVTADYAKDKLSSGIRVGIFEGLGADFDARFREKGAEAGKSFANGFGEAVKGIRVGQFSGTPSSGSGGTAPPPPPASPSSSGGGSWRRPHATDPIADVMTGTVVGGVIKHAGESIFDQAGAIGQTRAQLRAQGISDVEIAEVERRSRDTSARFPATTVPELMQAYGEARTIFATPEEALDYIPIAAQVDSGLRNLQSSEKWAASIDPEGSSRDIAKTLELLGVANNPEKARAYINGMFQAITAFKGQITPADFNMAVRYARGAGRGFDPEFLFSILPTLMAEFKARDGTAGPAGTALQSFYRTAVKGVMAKKQRAEWQELGLLGSDGRAIDFELARRNPLAWWQEEVAPKLAGMTPDKQRDAISQLFSTAIPEQMANIFNFDSQRLKKDAENVKKAANLDELNKVFENAPTQAISEVTAQWKNLLASFGDPVMPTAIGAMHALSGVFASLSNLFHDHPVAGGAAAGGALVGGGLLAWRLLPALLRSGVGRFALGSVLGGLVGGGLEGLLIGGALGLGASGAEEAAAGTAEAGVAGVAGAVAGKSKGLLARLAEALPKLRGLFGGILRFGPRLLGWGSVAATAYEVYKSKTFQSYVAAMEAIYTANAHPDDKYAQRLADLRRNDANNVMRSWWGGDPTAPPWRNSMFNPWLNRFYSQAEGSLGVLKPGEEHWLQDLHQPEKRTFVRRFLPHGGASFGGTNSSPIPVVVTQMPNQKMPPPQVNVGGVTVTVQGLEGAPDAAADAVRSKMQNALSDQHH